MKIHHFSYTASPPIHLLPEFVTAEKILVVVGDSWTNRMKEVKTVDSSWVPEYVKLRQYDLVIVVANQGDSSTQSFLGLINLFTQTELTTDVFQNKHTNWLTINVFQDKKVDVIVQWTSILRDFSEFSAWLHPYTFASMPRLHNDVFKKEMYDEYVMNILNEKYFSYKVQVYSWQLQKYFERWDIPYYFWMGFCDLVPESVENTDMDLRRYLNADRWFNLYDKPNNMSDYLFYIEKNVLPKRLKAVLTDGGMSGLKNTMSTQLSKLFQLYKSDSSLETTLFLHDLHPSIEGNIIIAKTLHERF